jgi:aspartyl-tRNA(Asn)/glutamyl-tRNA(Gln) amidotransferase subunit A
MAHYLTISDAAAALRARDVSATELVRHAITVADHTDALVGTFLTRFIDESLAAAAAADDAIAAGVDLGPLHGIPIGIKDMISTREGPTTAQSVVFDPDSSTDDATVAANLRAGGAVIMGKATMSEFSIGVPDEEKPFPIPRNPWDRTRWTGGSSSGSANGVACGAFLGAVGSDSGGSIRIPAAFCGISGLLPTYGLVPRTGYVPAAFTLDNIGPMARSARDCALLLGVMAGRANDYADGLSGDLRGVRIGVDRLARIAGDLESPALPALFDAAVASFESVGAEVVDVELPLYHELVAAVMVVTVSEALAYHRDHLQARWSDYFAWTRRIVAAGAFVSGADYVQAQRVREVGKKRLAQLFSDVDLVVTPTSSAVAISFADLDEAIGGAGMGKFGAVHTAYWNATGNPVLAVPIGLTATGLPLGLQIAGRPHQDASVLRAGDALQQQTDWHLRVPPVAAAVAELPVRAAR